MTHGALFAGIGGFNLAAEWAGIENVWANEIDPFCCKVLRKNFPQMKVYEEDIRNVKKWGSVDIITGGFPCQPFSKAGKKRSTKDDRWLWPDMLGVLQAKRPTFIILENVTEIKKMVLHEVLDDLESAGYWSESFHIPAYAVGALHNRDRLWVISIKRDSHDTNTNGFGSYQKAFNIKRKIELQHKQNRIPGSLVSKSIREGTNSRVFRDSNGIPNRVDRLKGLGNAIVPQVAYELFKAITDERQD